MSFIFGIAFLSLATIQALLGIVLNVFILTILIQDWVTNTVNACYSILIAVAFSNLGFISALFGYSAISMLVNNRRYNEIVYLISYMSQYFTFCGGSWLIACLCIYYCLKIVEINNPLFIKLKLRLSKMVPWMILTSLSVAMILTLPVYWDCTVEFPQNASEYTTGPLQVSCNVCFTIIRLLANFVPLVLVLFSLTLSLWALIKHTRRMKQNAMDFSQHQLEALSRAAKMMSCILILYVFSRIANYIRYDQGQKWGLSQVSTLVIMSYVPAQSLTLMLANAKLKQAFMRILHRTDH